MNKQIEKSRERTGEDERGGGAEKAEEGSSFIAAEGRRHLRFRSNLRQKSGAISAGVWILDLLVCERASERVSSILCQNMILR